MEVASLILGIIGTVTGIGALAWQVVTWSRSGPVVTLIARRSGRYEAEVIARNSGRGPVSVESLGVTHVTYGEGMAERIRAEAPDGP